MLFTCNRRSIKRRNKRFWNDCLWIILILPSSCCCLQTLSHVRLFGVMDCSPPDSPVHGPLQARILEWVVISSPGDLPDPWKEPASPPSAGGFFTTEPPGKVILPGDTGMKKSVDQILKYIFWSVVPFPNLEKGRLKGWIGTLGKSRGKFTESSLGSISLYQSR